jgi:hypothetical protein
MALFRRKGDDDHCGQTALSLHLMLHWHSRSACKLSLCHDLPENGLLIFVAMGLCMPGGGHNVTPVREFSNTACIDSLGQEVVSLAFVVVCCCMSHERQDS